MARDIDTDFGRPFIKIDYPASARKESAWLDDTCCP